MKLRFSLSSIEPMLAWLEKSKREGMRDEAELRSILSLPDYVVEFRRYSDKNLPNCNIFLEDAVDFFLRFDQKEFDNPRLAYKKPFFLDFYSHLEERIPGISSFSSLGEEDVALIQGLLADGLPDGALGDEDITILLTVSIGNSMGWPFENYIHFDVSNLGLIESKAAFCHIIAHEIYHLFFSSLVKEEMSGEELFLASFAFEGLAVHFDNNAETRFKPTKRDGPSYCIDKDSWALYDSELPYLMEDLRRDIELSKGMDASEVQEKLISKYEHFEYLRHHGGIPQKVMQYPTYYLGCLLWGTIDLSYGKETLFRTLMDPIALIEKYNQANLPHVERPDWLHL